MSGIDGEIAGQAVGVLMVAIVAAWRIVSGVKKGDGKPPDERAPTPHQMREDVAEILDRLKSLERGFAATDDDLRDLFRTLARIEALLRYLPGTVQHFNDRTLPPR